MVGEKEMSEKHSGTKTFTNTDYNDPYTPFGNRPPIRCPTHIGRCFYASHDGLTDFLTCWGFWGLKTPLDLATVMPGTNRKLLTLSLNGLYELGFGTIGTQATYSNALVKGDGATLYTAPNITHSKDAWTSPPNTYSVEKPLDNVSKLDIVLEQSVAVATGWEGVHDADVTIAYEYYNDIPNVKGDLEVEVIDVDTGSVLSGFAVRLLSGTTLLKRGTTGKDGRVLWTGIDEGSYTLKVYGIAPTYWSTGYETTEQTAVITGGVVNAYTVSMPLLPKLELPWWTWYAVGGAAVLGTVIAVPKVIGYSVGGAKKAYRGARTAGERIIKEVRYIRRGEEDEE